LNSTYSSIHKTVLLASLGVMWWRLLCLPVWGISQVSWCVEDRSPAAGWRGQ